MAYEIKALADDGAVLTNPVTGIAFGPMFEMEDHAEAFVAWLAETDRADDPSRLPHAELMEAYGEWFDAAVDGETGLLRSEP